jgi:hypothetical protein
VAPVLARGLDIEVVATSAYDTDRLGTFSGEVERTLSPLACARRKAELGVLLTGLPYGIGSEGTFGAGPLGGLGSWNVELLVWLDPAQDLLIAGRAQGPSGARDGSFDEAAAAEPFLAETPQGQGLILRCGNYLAKGLADAAAVRAAMAECGAGSAGRPFSLTWDLRAHQAPQRRQLILAAADDLLQRLSLLCPQCGRPDFAPDHVETGLPCRDCGMPTQEILRREARCAGCGHTKSHPASQAAADPMYCPGCNP